MDNLRTILSHRPYAIVQPEEHQDPLCFLRTLLDRGIRVVQIRAKQLSDRELKILIDEFCQTVHSYGGWLIVNDRVDLARDSDADGVHLGQTDMPPKNARLLLDVGPSTTKSGKPAKRKFIGLSTHNLEQVEQALSRPVVYPVDYLALGPIFHSPTKSGHAPLVGLDVLSQVARICPLPLVAIGGINESNIEAVYAAGATSAALISALTAHSLALDLTQKKGG